MFNKKCDIQIKLKSGNIKIIEKSINQYKEGESVNGVKIKAGDGVEFWLSVDYFNALFEEENKYF